jgi:hypothetical protein
MVHEITIVNSSGVENLFTTKHKCRNKGFDSAQPDNWELDEINDVNSSGVENLAKIKKYPNEILLCVFVKVQRRLLLRRRYIKY